MEVYTHSSICRHDHITACRDQALQPVVPAGSTSSFPKDHSRKSFERPAAEEHRPRIRLRRMGQHLDAENEAPQRQHPSGGIDCPIATPFTMDRASLCGLQIDLRSLRSLFSPRAAGYRAGCSSKLKDLGLKRRAPAGASGIPRTATMPWSSTSLETASRQASLHGMRSSGFALDADGEGLITDSLAVFPTCRYVRANLP